MRSIYDDNPHENKIVVLNNQEWYFKSVSDKEIQYREFVVQNRLYASNLVPVCRDYSDEGFYEEKVLGVALSNHKIVSEQMLVSLSQALKTIHCFLPRNEYGALFKNYKTTSYRYEPIKIFKLVIDGVDLIKIGVSRKGKKELLLVIDKLSRELTNHSCEPVLIHGDVSGSNVFWLNGGGIKLIDWTDCRIDIGISDFSQAIHLLKLDRKKKSILLDNYNDALNFPLLVEFQLLMHCLYDCVAKIKKNENYSTELNYLNAALVDVSLML